MQIRAYDLFLGLDEDPVQQTTTDDCMFTSYAVWLSGRFRYTF